MDDQRAEMRVDDEESEEDLPQFLRHLAREQPAADNGGGQQPRAENGEEANDAETGLVSQCFCPC